MQTFLGILELPLIESKHFTILSIEEHPAFLYHIEIPIILCRNSTVQVILSHVLQGAHGTGKIGKTGKMAKRNPCQGKHREFGNVVKIHGKHREFCLNTGKTQGIFFFFFPEAG